MPDSESTIVNVQADMAGTTVEPHSIAQLVRIALGEAGDPWRLSVVQRDAVWNDMQVRYLLDSLLWGYPIGSLLLCRVRRGGNVLVERDGARVRQAADASAWQLLDGQQRMNALVRLFSKPTMEDARRAPPTIGLSLVEDRGRDDVVRRRRSVERGLAYVRMFAEDQTIDERWQWLDVSGCNSALRAHEFGDVVRLAEGGGSEEDVLRIAEEIDPKCAAATWATQPSERRERAADRIRRLLRAWVAPMVPVVRLPLEDPIDVLQVFTRVNATGTPVAGDDVFFAAVKTLWPDAEEHLRRVQAATPLLPRVGALRLLARVANHELGHGDLLPLDVERLRGEHGRALVERIEALSQPGSALLERIAEVSLHFVVRSGLGYALRIVSPALLEPVFAWAHARPTWPVPDVDFEEAWAFVVGAAALKYREIFAETFERLAFDAALIAGRADAAFPLEAIAAHCRAKWPGLTRSRQTVSKVATEGEQRQLVDDNRALFLAVAQQVPFELQGRLMDWEHLFPQAGVDEHMRWKGASGGARLQRHPRSGDVWRAGNLMALDMSLNRRAGKDWPDEKLDAYRASEHWPPDLFLDAQEEALLRRACSLLRQQQVDAGMTPFAEYVRRREMRIFDTIAARFPRALVLARREDV